MNIYKKSKLRNLTNDELHKLLKQSQWNDKDLLREYDERFQKGGVDFKAGTIEEHFRLINFITRPPKKDNSINT